MKDEKKNVKKIALIICGHVRNLEESYNQHKFLLENYNCDVFISTWKNLGRKFKQKKYGGKEDDWIDINEQLDVNMLLDLFKPVAYDIEDINEFNEKFNDEFINKYLINTQFTSYARCKNAILGQFYKVQKAWNVFYNNKNKSYDLIIKSRFDINYRNINLNDVNCDNSIFFTDTWGADIGMNGVQDYIYISKNEHYMNILCNIFNYILNTNEITNPNYILPSQGKTGPVPELIIVDFLNKHKINIRLLNARLSLFK